MSSSYIGYESNQQLLLPPITARLVRDSLLEGHFAYLIDDTVASDTRRRAITLLYVNISILRCPSRFSLGVAQKGCTLTVWNQWPLNGDNRWLLNAYNHQP